MDLKSDHLSKSKYLIIYKKNDSEFIAYHRLFGNLRSINVETKKIIDFFEPHNYLENAKKFLPYESIQIQHFVELLYELYFLVDHQEDERVLIQSIIEIKKNIIIHGKHIGGIQLNLTNNCNSKCKYCFAETTTKRRHINNKKETSNFEKNDIMSFDMAIKSINKLINLRKINKYSSLVIKFFGGEPLLCIPLIKKIVRYFDISLKNTNFQIYWAITTNGSLIDHDLVNFFREHNFEITISIDGTRDFHNYLRPLKNSQDSFEKIDNGLKIFKEYGIKFDFSTVLTDYNKSNITSKFLEYAASLGVDEIKVLLAMQGEFLNIDSPEKLAEYLFQLYLYGIDKEIAITGYWYNPFSTLMGTSKTRSDNEIVRNQQNSCAATDFQLSIDPNGNIYPCRAMSMILGHVNDIDKILISHDFAKVGLRIYGNVQECKSCELEGFCQGECLGNSEYKFGDIYKIDKKFCEIYKKISKKLILNIPFKY